MPGQVWQVDTAGGHLGNPKLSKQMRYAASPMYKWRQFVDVKEALGRNANDTVLFNKVSKIDTAASTSGLTETNTIPEGKFHIHRGTITVTEYGNSIPYTGKLEALSEFDLDNPIQTTLRDDMADTIDKLVAYKGFQLNDGSGVLFYTMNSDGTSGGTWTTGTSKDKSKSDLTAYHIKNIVDKMKKNNVPTYDSEGNYMCIASVNSLRSLKDDDDWEEAAKYGDPERLFSGEVGRYYGVRFVEENNVLKNNVGSDSDNGEAVFFGKGAVMEAITIPEEVRAKIPTDYGRSKGLAWYFLGGWKNQWKESDANANSRIVFVTSSGAR